MYTTTTTPEVTTMQAPKVVPIAHRSFIEAHVKDLSFIRRFADVYNAQSKKTANPFRVFTALTGCKIEPEDMQGFIYSLLPWLNFDNLKLKHPLELPDGSLNLSTTTAPSSKAKEVKPARTFAALAKLAGNDPLRRQMQCIHLEESEAMVTDAHKLFVVECTHGTRAEIVEDARAMFERVTLAGISHGVSLNEITWAQDANTDKLNSTDKTVMVHAATGEATDEYPLRWREIMPTAPATHERVDTAKDLYKFAALGMDKARNIDKTLVRTFKFKGDEGLNVLVDCELLLEIATAFCELQCAWINITFQQQEKGNNAVRFAGITGDGMTARALLMPIAYTDEPRLLVETLHAYKR